jgi:hypothetical protein
MSIIKNFLIAIDQAINTLFRLDDEWGTPDETLSARAWRKRISHPAYARWIDRLLFWDKSGGKGHCQLSYEAEMTRAQLPAEYREA